MSLLLYVEMILGKYGYKIHLQTQHFIRQKMAKILAKKYYNCTPPTFKNLITTRYVFQNLAVGSF